jgi:hypothetical protein
MLEGEEKAILFLTERNQTIESELLEARNPNATQYQTT